MSQVASPASPDGQPIDWAMIQALYLQGLGPTAIAMKTGVKVNTISVMATRKGWAKSLQRAGEQRKAIEINVQQPEDDSPKLTAQSERTRTALADVLVRSAEKLAEVSLRSPKHALSVNQDAESLVRNAKTVFGWSDGQSQPSVRIGVLASFSVAPTPEPEPEPGPVIDVTSTPVQLPPSA